MLTWRGGAVESELAAGDRQDEMERRLTVANNHTTRNPTAIAREESTKKRTDGMLGGGVSWRSLVKDTQEAPLRTWCRWCEGGGVVVMRVVMLEEW